MVVPSRVEEASKIRKIVGALSRLNGFDKDEVDGIEVAVGEAMANAVRHGSPKGAHDTVEVSFRHHDQKYLEVIVADHGPGFDLPSRLASIDPLTMDEGQRGLLLISALMDEVIYTSGARGGVLCMRKYYRNQARDYGSNAPGVALQMNDSMNSLSYPGRCGAA